MQRTLCVAAAALAFAVAPVSAAVASPANISSRPTPVSFSPLTAVRSTSTVSPQCCAGTWYPWGYYPTEAACVAAGKKVVHDIPVAIAYKCRYGMDNHRTEWKLYIFEAG